MFALLALSGDLGCTSGPTLVGMASCLLGGQLKAGLLLAGKKPAYGVWFDVEDGQIANADLAATCQTFCGAMEAVSYTHLCPRFCAPGQSCSRQPLRGCPAR